MKNKKENLSEVVVRNSAFDLASNFIAKLGGMIFTIFILARLLGPELFGVYNLAFSIIAIILTFTDLGISSAATRYISEAIGKKDKKTARSYFKYFLMLKSVVPIIAIIILIFISKYLAFNFYKTPLLFFPLIFATFYIFISSIASLPQSFLYALKDLKKIPQIQLIQEISKIALSLAAIFIFTYEFEVPGIFLALAVTSLIVFIYSLFIVLKKDKSLIIGPKTQIEKPRILKYTWFMAISSISLVIFASVDTLMLGKFVDPSFIGYYRAALGLVLSVGALISVRSILMPVFTQINKKRLERGFEKVIKYNLMFSIPAAAGIFLLAVPIVKILYGIDYALAAPPLYILSFLIIIASLISTYKPLYQAREKPKLLAKALTISLVLNIILNYILITSFLSLGQSYAIIGAGLATLISRTFLLATLSIKSRSEFGLKLFKNKSNLFKPTFSAIIMSLFLIIINNFITTINIPILIIEIILAAAVYLIIMLLIKGITTQDLKLLNYIPFPFFKK